MLDSIKWEVRIVASAKCHFGYRTYFDDVILRVSCSGLLVSHERQSAADVV